MIYLMGWIFRNYFPRLNAPAGSPVNGQKITGLVSVQIYFMLKFLEKRIIPYNIGPFTIKQDIIVFIKTPVCFSMHINGVFRQVVRSRQGIGLFQHAGAVAVKPDLSRINRFGIDTHSHQILVTEPVNACL